MPDRKSFYGIVGNGETCALISPRGSIDWLCLPKFDDFIVLSRALDPVNGNYLDMVFLENNEELLVQSSSQEYIKNTNILVTKLSMKDMQVEVTDFMPWIAAVHMGPNPDRCIVRMITIRNDSATDKEISMKLRTNVKSSKASTYIADNEIIYEHEKFAIGASFFGENIDAIPLKSGLSTDVKIVIFYDTDANKLRSQMKRWNYRNIDEELGRCKDFWVNWIDRGRKLQFKSNSFEEMYYRSLLALKLLSYEHTGAVLAAPTASFPAYPGMSDNWDYRFTWIRDSYFACRAFLLTGHYEEVRRILHFFYKIQGKDGHWRMPFYTIDGKRPPDEIVVENIQGDKGESIVIGNAAKGQFQLDSEGSVLYATYLYFLFTKDRQFLAEHWKNIERAANWIAKNYDKEENGLWELRKKKSHYVYGKVLCWAGLESAVNIAKVLGKKRFEKWRRTKDELKQQVVMESWSKQRQAFLQHYGEDAPVDISALAVEDYGLVKPNDSRMKKTVKLMEKKLNVKGGIARFENAVLPFYLPTLWLASHYIRAGNLKRANELIMMCINSTTDLYLPAEHFDPVNGTQHGNFPQAFCMSSFVEQLIMLKEGSENRLKFANILNMPLAIFLKSVDTGRKGLERIFGKGLSVIFDFRQFISLKKRKKSNQTQT